MSKPKQAKAQSKKYLAVTLMKSRFGRLPKHRATLLGLGLKKIRQTVRLEDTACVRGMIHQVSYLLKVEQC